MKKTIKSVAVNLVLLFFTAGAFYIYINARDPGLLTLVSGIIALTVVFIYDLVIYHRHASDAGNTEDEAAQDEPEPEHIEPISAVDVNGDVPAIQVDPHIMDSIKIGKNYYNGRGLPRDFTKAFSLLFEGALAGDAEAQMYVGRMFMYGQGISPNLNNGKVWLEASSFQGNAEAQYLLGTVYAEKDDTVSMLKAVYFLTKSSEQGSEKARMRLRELMRNNTAAQKADLKSVSSECYYDYENNPFISGICIAANQSRRMAADGDLKRAYKLLNVDEAAGSEEIRQAYLDLMLRFHPDKNRVDSQKVLQVRDAYDLICEHLKREPTQV
jgi:TPR repeat protein